MKPFQRLALLIIILSTGCTAAPFGRAGIPTARPLTATPTFTDTAAPQPDPATSTATPSPTRTPIPTAISSPTHTPAPTGATETPESPTPTPTAAPPQIAVVAAGNANVYSGPGLDFKLLAILSADFRVEVTGISENGIWVVVRLPRGVQGWLQAASLAPGLAVASLPSMPAPPKPVLTGTAVPAPVVEVSPGALAPGAEYTITLRNFLPHEQVTLRVIFTGNGFLVFKVVATARADGTQEVILTTSPVAPEGAYLLTAFGEAGSYAEVEFYVGPAPESGGN